MSHNHLKKLWKHSGLFLSLTGALHICVSLMDFGGKYKGMLADGLEFPVRQQPGACFLVSDYRRAADYPGAGVILLYKTMPAARALILGLHAAGAIRHRLYHCSGFRVLAFHPAGGNYRSR